MNVPMTILEFIIALVSSSAFASSLTYMVTRKKASVEVRKLKAETDQLEIKNVHEVIEFWKSMVTDLTEEVGKLRKEVLEFKIENRELKKEITTLKGIIEKANSSHQ